jgi:hypothetical protein
MASLDNLSLTKVLDNKKRIVIDVRYYDEGNTPIQRSEKAHRIDLTIRNSLFLKATTEDYGDPKPFGKGDLVEIETNNYTQIGNDIVYSTKVEAEEYRNFTTIVLSKLATKITTLSLRVETESEEIFIGEEVIKHILNNFSFIHLNLQGILSWTTLPEVTAEVSYLCIENAQLYITQTILTCKDNFILRNCVLRSPTDFPKRPSLLVTVGKTATINTLKIANKLFLSVSGNVEKELSAWKNTAITVSDVVIGFEDKEKNELKRNGSYDPLITIAEVAETRITEVSSINDIPYYTLMSIKKVTSVNITNIIRATKEIPAISPALQLSEYYTAFISGITYFGKSKTVATSAFIRFNKVRIDSSLTVSNANLLHLPILNVTGITCQKISISDSSIIDTNGIYNLNTATIGKLLLSNVTIKGGNSLHLKALSLSILSATYIEMKENITLEVEDICNINDSLLVSNNTITCILSAKGTMNINKTTVKAIKEITSYTNFDEDETVSSHLMYNTSHIESRKLSFDKMSFLRFDNLELKINQLEIKNCKICTLGINNYYQNAPVPVTLIKSTINPSLYSIFSPGSIQELRCIESNGRFTIQYLDNESPSSVFKLYLIDSKMNIDFDAVTDRKVLVNSENSLGSHIITSSDGVSIIPDIESVDRQSFERVKNKNQRDDKKILYGVIA